MPSYAEILASLEQGENDDLKERYVELEDIISLEKITFGPTYAEEEREFLTPQLEALGYKQVLWYMGDHDSFGPLTRVVCMTDSEGNVKWGVYG